MPSEPLSPASTEPACPRCAAAERHSYAVGQAAQHLAHAVGQHLRFMPRAFRHRIQPTLDVLRRLGRLPVRRDASEVHAEALDARLRGES